jgi:hypothetical protein
MPTQNRLSLEFENLKFPDGTKLRATSGLIIEHTINEPPLEIPEGAIVTVVSDPGKVLIGKDLETREESLMIRVEYKGVVVEEHASAFEPVKLNN